MPRHNRRRSDRVLRPPAGGAAERREDWRGVPYTVRALPAAVKPYRCPGCDQEIRPGTGHLVAWPAERPDDRRHWHSPCWTARDRRAPALLRGSSAPRY